MRMKRREDLQVNMAGLRRNIKNITHNYTEAQVKVREATSNDHWGPSSTIMSEIADLTYNVVAFTEIMSMIWKRLNDHGKNWRHVYKALLLLEYLIKTGSEKVAQQCKENIFAIETLKDFQYLEEGKDHGLNVREKSKQLVNLLKDDERFRVERTKALKAKERLAQAAGFGSEIVSDRVFTPVSPQNTGSRDTWNSSCSSSSAELPTKAEIECARPQSENEEELQLQLALAMSREEAEQEEQKRRSDDVRLQLAITQSEKEFKQTGTSTLHHQQSTLKSSHLADLLEIDPNLCSSQPPLVDPWGMPISAPTTVAPPLPRAQVTRQGQRPGGKTSQKNDPWSVSSSPAFASSPSATPSTISPPDAWAGNRTHSIGVSKVSKDDAWSPVVGRSTSTPPVPSLPQRNVDPWAPQPSVTDDDDFIILGSRNTTSYHNGNCTSPDIFDLSSLENGLTGNQSESSKQALRKTPQSFLGENSSLVNLDKLITTPVVPPLPVATQKPGPAANPFGPLVSGGDASTNGSSYASKLTTYQDPFQPIGKSQSLQPNPFLS